LKTSIDLALMDLIRLILSAIKLLDANHDFTIFPFLIKRVGRGKTMCMNRRKRGLYFFPLYIMSEKTYKKTSLYLLKRLWKGR
jgi:hypothetical protein